MTKTMKAAVVHGFGRPVTIDDIPIPDPGPGELLVKVTRAAFATQTCTRQTGIGR
jgi:D-arabinose 1-dehydrogenase-like Zn-dependent alcohol dehydrogenase